MGAMTKKQVWIIPGAGSGISNITKAAPVAGNAGVATGRDLWTSLAHHDAQGRVA
jgi:hypothetical protein